MAKKYKIAINDVVQKWCKTCKGYFDRDNVHWVIDKGVRDKIGTCRIRKKEYSRKHHQKYYQ